MILKCIGFEDGPIKGYVEFVFADGKSFGRKLDAGTVEVPERAKSYPKFAIVKPMDGHWNTIVMRPSSVDVCRCEKIVHADDKPWWKAVVGVPGVGGRGKGIRIGVIDLACQPWPSLQHVRFMDAEGDPLDFNYVPPTSHGMHVCQVLCGRGRNETESGIATEAEVLFVDVSDEANEEHIDSELIPAAIHLLADLEADVINISGGSYVMPGKEEEAGQVMQSAVAYARDAGCIVVAATGNEAMMPPAIPARLDHVIGVGGMGKAQVSPVGSLMQGVEEKAKKQKGAWGKTAAGEVFHYLHSSHGAGLDVVAPAVGVTICYEGTSTFDREGTSFASPIVAGTLACALSADPAYKLLTGRQRSDFAAKKLISMCTDLGLDENRQGKGLPVLCSAC